MKKLAMALVVAGVMIVLVQPVNAGEPPSVRVDPTVACTAEGARTITWHATLSGADRIDEAATFTFNFVGEQFGVLNPDSSVYLVIEPQFFTETYPGGASVLESSAVTGGDGQITGPVSVDASAVAFDVSDPGSLLTFEGKADVTLIDPCPQPVATTAVEPTVASVAAPTVRPSFTG